MSLNIIYHSTGDTVESDTDAINTKGTEPEHVDTLESADKSVTSFL